jgi:hypothetical protein
MLITAIRHVRLTRGSDYGRPITINEFLDECGRHSSRLIKHSRCAI